MPMRSPSPNTVPECFGRGPKPVLSCNECSQRVSCKQYARSRPKSLFELNEEESEKRTKKETQYDADELAEWAVKMSRRYGKFGRYWTAEKRGVFASLAETCFEANVDAKVWIEAQFHALGDFFKQRRLAVPVGTLTGENARNRYRKFVIDDGRIATGNVRKQSARSGGESADAEFTYGHAVIVLGLKGKTLRSFESDLMEDNPDWDKDDWDSVREARICAAVTVCELVLPGSSRQICPPKDRWEWSELAEYLLSVSPHAGSDGKKP